MNKPLALVIEDDESLSFIFESALSEAGYTTESASDGLAAMQRLQELTPYLVLLDLHLPFVAGPEILRFIRNDARLKDIHVIVSTADDRLASEQRIGDNVTFVLLKPLSFRQLSHLAQRLLPTQ